MPLSLKDLPDTTQGGYLGAIDDIVKVVSVLRYTPDDSYSKARFSNLTGQSLNDEQQDAVDLLISDGAFKMKVMVSPELNHYIFQNAIHPSSFLKILQILVRFDEIGNPLFIVMNIRIEKPDIVPACFKKSNEESLNFDDTNIYQPLTKLRSFYKNLWNETDYVTEDLRWRPRDLISEEEDLPDFDDISQTIRLKTRGPLVGRIVAISRLRFYSPSSKSSFPALFYFRIVDRTGCVDVAVWSNACASFYSSLFVDDMVCITEYRLKKKFDTSWAAMGSNQLLRGINLENFDVAINPSGPRGIIKILMNEYLNTRLPFRTYRWESQTEPIVDATGIIYYLGRSQREKILFKHTNCYFEYRWVGIRNCFGKNVYIKLYNSGNPQVKKLDCGKILLCTELTHFFMDDNDSLSPAEKEIKEKYFRTSHTSRMYVTDPNVDPNSGETDVSFPPGIDKCDELIQDFQNDNFPSLAYSKFGYRMLPPVSLSVKTGGHVLPQSTIYVPLIEVKNSLRSLQYKETLRFFVHCLISKITLRRPAKEVESPPASTTSTKILSSPIKKKRRQSSLGMRHSNRLRKKLGDQSSPSKATSATTETINQEELTAVLINNDVDCTMKTTSTFRCWEGSHDTNDQDLSDDDGTGDVDDDDYDYDKTYWVFTLQSLNKDCALDVLVLPNTIDEQKNANPYAPLLNICPFLNDGRILKSVTNEIDSQIVNSLKDKHLIFALDVTLVNYKEIEVVACRTFDPSLQKS